MKLRKIQANAHRDLDRTFDPIADEAEAMVAKHAIRGTDGVARITPLSRLLILADLEWLLATHEPETALRLMRAVETAARLGADDGDDAR